MHASVSEVNIGSTRRGSLVPEAWECLKGGSRGNNLLVGELSVDRRGASNLHNGNGHRGGIEMPPGLPDPGGIRTMMDAILEPAAQVPDMDMPPVSRERRAQRGAPRRTRETQGSPHPPPASERLTIEPWRLLITVPPIPQEGQEAARKPIFAPRVRWETHTYARGQRRGEQGRRPWLLPPHRMCACAMCVPCNVPVRLCAPSARRSCRLCPCSPAPSVAAPSP